MFPSFFVKTNYAVVEQMQRWSLYGYDTWEALQDHLWLTAGFSYDRLDYPGNFRQVPISPGQAAADQWGPKAALVYSPWPVATLRLAHSRALAA